MLFCKHRGIRLCDSLEFVTSEKSGKSPKIEHAIFITDHSLTDYFDKRTVSMIFNLCHVVVVIDLPLLRVAVEGSDNPVSLEKPCQASLPPDQQGRHSLGRHPEVQYVA